MAKTQSKNGRQPRLDAEALAGAVFRGESRAAARVMTLIDDRDPRAREILKRLYPRMGRALIIGVTGSAGSGKSTLIGRMAGELRRRKKQVGILAVDPSSAFSGGALLGDRLRMRELFLDDGVFIRSLATRGSPDGISGAVLEAAQLLDAMGKEYVFIETIGIGQDQIGIAGPAHRVMMVISPESGDEIQGLKAGVSEIADLLVFNKADLPGAAERFDGLAQVFADLPAYRTSALTGEGIGDLVDGLGGRGGGVQGSKERSLELSRRQLLTLVREAWLARIEDGKAASAVERWAKKVAEKRCDPYSAAERIVAEMAAGGGRK